MYGKKNNRRCKKNEGDGLTEPPMHLRPNPPCFSRERKPAEGGSARDPQKRTHLGLRDKLGLLHVLPCAEAAGPLLVHLGPRSDAVDRHVQDPLRPHDVRHYAVDVVEDAQDDVPLAQLGFGFPRRARKEKEAFVTAVVM